MGKKGNFGAGLILGVAAGFAAKYLSDNKEEVKAVISEKAQLVKDGVNDFAGYANDKINSVSEEVTKVAGEYVDFAKEQFNEIKNTLTADLMWDDSEDPEESAIELDIEE